MLFVVAGGEHSALQMNFEHPQLAFAGQADMGRLDRQAGEEIGAVRGGVLLDDFDQFQRKRIARAVDQPRGQHPGSGESPAAETVSFAPHGPQRGQIDAVENRHARQRRPLAGRGRGPADHRSVTASSRGPHNSTSRST